MVIITTTFPVDMSLPIEHEFLCPFCGQKDWFYNFSARNCIACLRELPNIAELLNSTVNMRQAFHLTNGGNEC